jgi:hypothetical protein
MQRHLTLSAMSMLVFVLGCAHAPERASVAAIDDDALAAMQAYEYGDSRETLSVVEDMVRDAANGPDGGQALAAELAALLGARGTTHDAKQFICRQLWIIGTENEVAAIAPLLRDPKTSDMARYALEGIPGSAVDAALLEALPRTSGKTKAGIISSLGNRRAGSAREALRPLTADADPIIAAAAVSALEKLGS